MHELTELKNGSILVIPSCVYRLLAHNEKPTETLTACDPSANVTVFGHVRGTAKKTQFISTSASLKACQLFLKKAIAKKNRKYIIVEINLEMLRKMRKDLNIIDLTDNAALNKHIPANPNSPKRGFMYNARKWATDTKEILLHVCKIPSKCMKVVCVTHDSHSMNTVYDRVESDDESDSENCSSARKRVLKKGDKNMKKGKKEQEEEDDGDEKDSDESDGTSDTDDEEEEEESERETKPKRVTQRSPNDAGRAADRTRGINKSTRSCKSEQTREKHEKTKAKQAANGGRITKANKKSTDGEEEEEEEESENEKHVEQRKADPKRKKNSTYDF
ncbi:RNA-binding protein 28-like isoform X1 [Mya arenaria]|uniref:RNA-binding protein 28-like isoform X1 n=1 Tax=Mya arenaria TaxID=6604 RepID=UPI0022E655E5|nr:RNA-binding protein 28-like isoform X1 [Mya arenaria]